MLDADLDDRIDVALGQVLRLALAAPGPDATGAGRAASDSGRGEAMLRGFGAFSAGLPAAPPGPGCVPPLVCLEDLLQGIPQGGDTPAAAMPRETYPFVWDSTWHCVPVRCQLAYQDRIDKRNHHGNLFNYNPFNTYYTVFDSHQQPVLREPSRGSSHNSDSNNNNNSNSNNNNSLENHFYHQFYQNNYLRNGVDFTAFTVTNAPISRPQSGFNKINIQKNDNDNNNNDNDNENIGASRSAESSWYNLFRHTEGDGPSAINNNSNSNKNTSTDLYSDDRGGSHAPQLRGWSDEVDGTADPYSYNLIVPRQSFLFLHLGAMLEKLLPHADPTAAAATTALSSMPGVEGTDSDFGGESDHNNNDACSNSNNGSPDGTPAARDAGDVSRVFKPLDYLINEHIRQAGRQGGAGYFNSFHNYVSFVDGDNRSPSPVGDPKNSSSIDNAECVEAVPGGPISDYEAYINTYLSGGGAPPSGIVAGGRRPIGHVTRTAASTNMPAAHQPARRAHFDVCSVAEPHLARMRRQLNRTKFSVWLSFTTPITGTVIPLPWHYPLSAILDTLKYIVWYEAFTFGPYYYRQISMLLQYYITYQARYASSRSSNSSNNNTINASKNKSNGGSGAIVARRGVADTAVSEHFVRSVFDKVFMGGSMVWRTVRNGIANTFDDVAARPAAPKDKMGQGRSRGDGRLSKVSKGKAGKAAGDNGDKPRVYHGVSDLPVPSYRDLTGLYPLTLTLHLSEPIPATIGIDMDFGQIPNKGSTAHQSSSFPDVNEERSDDAHASGPSRALSLLMETLPVLSDRGNGCIGNVDDFSSPFVWRPDAMVTNASLQWYYRTRTNEKARRVFASFYKGYTQVRKLNLSPLLRHYFIQTYTAHITSSLGNDQGPGYFDDSAFSAPHGLSRLSAGDLSRLSLWTMSSGHPLSATSPGSTQESPSAGSPWGHGSDDLQMLLLTELCELLARTCQLCYSSALPLIQLAAHHPLLLQDLLLGVKDNNRAKYYWGRRALTYYGGLLCRGFKLYEMNNARPALSPSSADESSAEDGAGAPVARKAALSAALAMMNSGLLHDDAESSDYLGYAPGHGGEDVAGESQQADGPSDERARPWASGRLLLAQGHVAQFNVHNAYQFFSGSRDLPIGLNGSAGAPRATPYYASPWRDTGVFFLDPVLPVLLHCHGTSRLIPWQPCCSNRVAPDPDGAAAGKDAGDEARRRGRRGRGGDDPDATLGEFIARHVPWLSHLAYESGTGTIQLSDSHRHSISAPGSAFPTPVGHCAPPPLGGHDAPLPPSELGGPQPCRLPAVLVQGIQPLLSTPLLALHRLFSSPDMILHITVVPMFVSADMAASAWQHRTSNSNNENSWTDIVTQ